jgi:AcrR family transcriptional regulator
MSRKITAITEAKRPSRASGRPLKTSREAIIACAIEILEKEPGAGVSLNRIAKTMNISPMSIYNYFDSRDKLLQALSSHLLADLGDQAILDADIGRETGGAGAIDYCAAANQ